ncbi:MAG TPA: phosphoesterase, partial [Janthinobacterium sp.]|nr:phosphoesterase [Janthinobacterium sp.]
IVISPLSSDLQRLMEANGSDYPTEKQNLATRLSVTPAQVVSDANAVTDAAAKKAMLTESNALGNRFAYAISKLDRGDLYPDALAFPGGDPEIKGLSGVTSATAAVTDTRKAITFQQSQQAAFEIEGVPRYDQIFIVMLENKGTNTILNSPLAPKINGYLKEGNQFTSYFATGNPSEPNYTALGGADDFGISDDSPWNCDASGANAVKDLPLPDKTQPGLASSPFNPTCTQPAAINHNVTAPNLFNALTSAGMSWRTYSESMNPGQDFRTDSVADAAVSAADRVYAPGTLNGNTTAIGNAALSLPMPAGLYKTKHHPGMAYQNVRSAPEFKFSNRTLGGGQWDASLLKSSAYAVPAGYDVDQFGSDLASGNVGNINFIMPDQCDDMHSINVSGKAGGVTATASDCSGSNIITRGDNYVDALVKKIKASKLWSNPQKKVAIVIMFDEGSATAGFNSCCGWNTANSTVAKPLKRNADGTWSPDTSVVNYTKGNRGHGESIYGVLTNQADAPKGQSDSDAYSHFSFVRTLQDMFQLADPKVDASYMNRSKYSERFIAQNILNLPEYAGSADTHFDAVRPMNHAYVIPASYVQKQSSDIAAGTQAQVGPDATQVNLWALKK